MVCEANRNGSPGAGSALSNRTRSDWLIFPVGQMTGWEMSGILGLELTPTSPIDLKIIQNQFCGQD